MTSLPMAQDPPRMNAWHMYRAMVGIGILCGLLIVVAFELTRPVIVRAQAAALQRAVFQVLPEASASQTFVFDEASFRRSTGDDAANAERVYAGYDDGGRLVGVAVEARGMGYQDVIRVLYGYSPAREALVGIRVLDSKETPGLGTKIETDPDFLASFRELDVSLTANQEEIVHPIELVKHGTRTQPWEIDAITGATISSAAVASLLERSTAYWIPRIRPQLDDFRRPEQP